MDIRLRNLDRLVRTGNSTQDERESLRNLLTQLRGPAPNEALLCSCGEFMEACASLTDAQHSENCDWLRQYAIWRNV